MQPSHHQPGGHAPQSPSAPLPQGAPQQPGQAPQPQSAPHQLGAPQPSEEAKTPFWKRFLAVLIPVAIVLTLRLLPGDLGVRITFGIAAGLVAGLLPYFVGRNRNRKWAVAALLVSGAIGAYGGLLFAVPAAVLMTLVLWLALKPANTNQAGAPGQYPAPGVPGPAPQHGQHAPQSTLPGYGQHAPQPGQAPQPAQPGYGQQPGQPDQPTQPGQWPTR